MLKSIQLNRTVVIVYLNPLRHDPNAALKRRIDIGGKIGVPMQKAVQGETAAGQYIDYRGTKVVAAWRYLPMLDWGMVAKIDAKEAFADVTNLRSLSIMILIIVLAISGILAFSIAKSISEPIKRLSLGAQKVGGGNLDHKVGTNLKDEIGQLSRIFDKMTEDLKTTTASRNELNHEIADRIQAEESLQKASDDLVRSNKDLEQFAYIASHDLQEPLRVITGYLQLIAKRYKGRLDSDADEFINFAVDGANRMQSLIIDLLTYSRVLKKAKPFAEVDCDLLLVQALANLEVAIKTTNAVITHDPLPTIMADGTQLIQVFQNLIGNAIKFRGNKKQEIHVTAKHDTNEWVFSVKDNGIGIESAYKERIFVIFQRLHSREEYPGTGIGLAICKKIVERHGGRIWLESTPGEGSTFYFAIQDKGD
ncbi:MAG: ATP-binding protein [Sedimentisphaerales bacterium]|nr:ATP-binding protein [Sedimentisphaerales bacterium]